MQARYRFTVAAPIDEAWAVLLDIDRVAHCMPGATLDTVDGDRTTGWVKVKVGPIVITYQGVASFVEKDEATHRAGHRRERQGESRFGNRQRQDHDRAHRPGRGDRRAGRHRPHHHRATRPIGRGVIADVAGTSTNSSPTRSARSWPATRTGATPARAIAKPQLMAWRPPMARRRPAPPRRLLAPRNRRRAPTGRRTTQARIRTSTTTTSSPSTCSGSPSGPRSSGYCPCSSALAGWSWRWCFVDGVGPDEERAAGPGPLRWTTPPAWCRGTPRYPAGRLAAEPALLHPTEGSGRGGGVDVVDADDAEAQSLHDEERPG